MKKYKNSQFNNNEFYYDAIPPYEEDNDRFEAKNRRRKHRQKRSRDSWEHSRRDWDDSDWDEY